MTDADRQIREMAFHATPIYQRLVARIHGLSREAAKMNLCPVTREELEELETAAPSWQRFHTAAGDFTLGPFSWHFRVTDG